MHITHNINSRITTIVVMLECVECRKVCVVYSVVVHSAIITALWKQPGHHWVPEVDGNKYVISPKS